MEELKVQQRPYNIVITGPPGIGKSTICNQLIYGNNEGKYKVS
jgi:broad-specificity NMP kinase